MTAGYAAVLAIVQTRTSETTEPFAVDNGAVTVTPADDETVRRSASTAHDCGVLAGPRALRGRLTVLVWRCAGERRLLEHARHAVRAEQRQRAVLADLPAGARYADLRRGAWHAGRLDVAVPWRSSISSNRASAAICATSAMPMPCWRHG
jgi:hypothetical protein